MNPTAGFFKGASQSQTLSQKLQKSEAEHSATLGRVAMLKILATGTLGLAFVCGSAGVVSAQTYPSNPPGRSYILPGAPGLDYGEGLREGRSIYRFEDPGTFYGGSDEKGYPSGNPQNPQTGG